MDRRCGASQPTPTPLTCKAETNWKSANQSRYQKLHILERESQNSAYNGNQVSNYRTYWYVIITETRKMRSRCQKPADDASSVVVLCIGAMHLGTDN